LLFVGLAARFVAERAPAPETLLFAGSALAVLALFAARATGSARVLVVFAPLLAALIVVFSIELAGRVRAAHFTTWADAMRGSLDDEEALGPGGRLKPNLDTRLRSNEHPFAGSRLVTNALGFRNAEEVTEHPAKDELRVLSLGDSFSCGFELGQDEFLGPLVEKRLPRVKEKRLHLLNAEISDPAHALLYLQRDGWRFAPEVVLLGICGND